MKLTGPARIFIVLIFLPIFSTVYADLAGAEKNLSKINLPEGFNITVFAEVPGARQMALGQSPSVKPRK